MKNGVLIEFRIQIFKSELKSLRLKQVINCVPVRCDVVAYNITYNMDGYVTFKIKQKTTYITYNETSSTHTRHTTPQRLSSPNIIKYKHTHKTISHVARGYIL